MAGTLVITPTNGDSSWVTWIEQVERMKKGFHNIYFSNMANDNEPVIQNGSWVEIDGAMYQFTSNEGITGWGAISNESDVYVKFIPDGSSITAEFVETVPTWDDLKRGWYNGDDRYLLSLYKDDSGDYTKKRIYDEKITPLGWVLTGAGTIKVPRNGFYRVKVYAGGGGGGGCGGGAITGAGGGGGAGACIHIYELSAGDTLTYSIGTGGAGGGSGGTNGGAGNSSSITDGSNSTVASGGSGGALSAGGAADKPGGVGGSGNGDFAEGNPTGTSGGSGNGARGGSGGRSPGASTEPAVTVAGNGVIGNSYGGGGSGGFGSSKSGGAGAAGVGIIEIIEVH